jgi:hypothetical protein
MQLQKMLYPLLISALLWSVVAPLNPMPAKAAPAPISHAQEGQSDYTFGDCSEIDKDELRSEIETVARTALTAESATIDIDTIVMRQWVAVGMDRAIDAEIERAVEEVYTEEGYWSRLWSGWSAEKAEEYATRIAASTFGSPTFAAQIETLSAAIADEIARDIEANFARAASAAFLCMKAYVGDRYSGTLFTTFEQKVSTEVGDVDVEASTGGVDVSALDVHQKAIGGLGLIVVTEISRRIAVRLSEKIAERIAGKIVGRVIGKAGSTLIPVAGWVIGLGLIVWDLWEGGNGALPQIRDALQSEEVKVKIRQEVAAAVKGGLPEEVSIVALEIAVTLVEEWNSFCDNNRSVCTLADSNANFRDILNYTPLDQVDKLVTLVDVFVNNLGRAELESAVDSGQFEKLLTLPEATFTLLAETKSVDELLAWQALAGDRLDRAIALGIVAQKSSSDFDEASLKAVLNVDDQAAVDKLLTLDRNTLITLTNFAGTNFVRLANRLSATELAQLHNYLADTATVPADLAGRLASGEVSVASLFAVETAADAAPTVAAEKSYDPLVFIAPLWQFIYANSIVVAATVLLCLALLIGLISTMRGRSRRAASPKAQSKPKRKKPRDVYDIFGDGV